MLWWILSGAVLGYFIVVFGVFRLTVPHLGRNRPPVGQIPESMQKEINELKTNNPTKTKFAKAAYDYLTEKYIGKIFNPFKHTKLAFLKLEEAWTRTGYLPCNQSAYMYYAMLRKSGLFSHGEVEMRTTWHHLNIHRYVHVNVDGGIDVDVWGASQGIPYGEYGKGIL